MAKRDYSYPESTGTENVRAEAPDPNPVADDAAKDAPPVAKIVEYVFAEREKFIVIGLTGRIGSGCTTTANLLCKKFEDLQLPLPALTNISEREDREYAIIHKYASSNDHWKPFKRVAARDAIVTYIIACNNDKLIAKIKEHFPETDVGEFKKEYEQLCDAEVKQKNQELTTFCDNRKSYSGEIPPLFEFLEKELPIFSTKLRELLHSKTKSRDSYTLLFQWFGNNIRTSGDCLNSECTDVHYFDLAKRINGFIKLYRENCGEGQCRIVIDSIKTPLEASYLRDRYSAFFLFALNIDETVRFSRLNDVNNLTKKQILQADVCEYPKHLKTLKELIENGASSEHAEEQAVYNDYKKWFPDDVEGLKNFVHQNVEECIQKADIHINSSDADGNFLALKKKILRYVTLIMHPGIVLPTPIERCMQIAFSAKVNSGCVSRQVGAVVTDSSFGLRSIGWNDAPECVESCIYRNLEYLTGGNDSPAYSMYERGADTETNSVQFFELLKKRYDQFSKTDIKDLYPVFCFKDEYNSFKNTNNQVHTRGLHGEEKAFLSILKHSGESVEGGFLFTTSSPCELCAKKAYDLGIVNIYYIEPYPGITQAHVLGVGNAKGRPVPKHFLFTGAIGRVYTQIYTPVFPAKDELKWRGFEKRSK